MSSQSALHPSLNDPNAWVPYRYHPSQAAAGLFAALFSIATIVHLVVVARRRTWYFIPFIVGGILELAGYIARAVSSNDIWALGPYIIQSIFLLVAPALFAASIYIILGRIIRYVQGEQYSLVPVRWLTRAFVCGDVVAFLTQMAGGGIQAVGSLSTFKAGEKIIIVGLFLQVTFFGFFIVVATVFHRRYERQAAKWTQGVLWKQQMSALYAGSGLIMARSIFRIVEYLMGNNGFLLRHEYFLYIFDATLMLILMLLFLWIHPSQITDPRRAQELESKRTSGFSLQRLRERGSREVVG